MSKKKLTAFKNIRLIGVHKEPTFALGEAMSKGICKKCKSTDSYNFAINNGLCNSCIAEKLDELSTAKEENKRLRIAINIAKTLICSDDNFGGDAQKRGIRILEQAIGGE